MYVNALTHDKGYFIPVGVFIYILICIYMYVCIYVQVEPPDRKWQYLLFAAEPYETISFKVVTIY